jgi:hypothetical protein
VTIRRRRLTEELIVVAEEDPTVQLVPTETNRPLTQSERTLRDAWLGSKH